jgi:hypothetical protein
MTRKKFREGLLIFETIKLQNPPNLEDRTTEDVWFMLLKHLSDEAFMRAVKILAGTSTFFPKPADIIEAAIPKNILQANNAWEEVQIEIDRITSMGGLHSIWIDSRDQYTVQKEFKRKYNEIILSDKMINGGDFKELEASEE